MSFSDSKFFVAESVGSDNKVWLVAAGPDDFVKFCAFDGSSADLISNVAELLASSSADAADPGSGSQGEVDLATIETSEPPPRVWCSADGASTFVEVETMDWLARLSDSLKHLIQLSAESFLSRELPDDYDPVD